MIEISVGSRLFTVRGSLRAPPHPYIVSLLIPEEPTGALLALDEFEGPVTLTVDGREVFRAVGLFQIVARDDHWLAEVQLREAVRAGRSVRWWPREWSNGGSPVS